jgi:hypothetical protein
MNKYGGRNSKTREDPKQTKITTYQGKYSMRSLTTGRESGDMFKQVKFAVKIKKLGVTDLTVNKLNHFQFKR